MSLAMRIRMAEQRVLHWAKEAGVKLADPTFSRSPVADSLVMVVYVPTKAEVVVPGHVLQTMAKEALVPLLLHKLAQAGRGLAAELRSIADRIDEQVALTEGTVQDDGLSRTRGEAVARFWFNQGYLNHTEDSADDGFTRLYDGLKGQAP